MREGVQQSLGVEPRDRQDQVGLSEHPGHPHPTPRRLVLQELPDVMAGHRLPRPSRGDEELGRAVDPVDRPGPPLDRRPGLDPPPSQERAGAHRDLTTRGDLQRLPVGQAVGMGHPAGQHGQGDLGTPGQSIELSQRMASHPGGVVAAVHVVEQADPQGGGRRRRRRASPRDGILPPEQVFARRHRSPRHLAPLDRPPNRLDGRSAPIGCQSPAHAGPLDGSGADLESRAGRHRQ